jgi:RND family efflux transporter MFP subunit
MRNLSLPWPALVVVVPVLVGAGLAGGYLVSKRGGVEAPAATVEPTAVVAAPPSAAGALLPDVLITLASQVAAHADLKIDTVTSGVATQALRIPAVVRPNAYTQVTITPLVTGRVTEVPAAIGDRVRAAQPLARIQSPALAQSETEYVAMQADDEADQRELARLTDLLDKGGASQRQVEQARAAHVRDSAALAAARSHLTLLGLSTDDVNRLKSETDISSVVTITAPRDGVITARQATAGLAVEATTELFTVADLSSVWVIGSLFAPDAGHVPIGTPVSLEGDALDGASTEARVSYVDPELNPVTRAIEVRVDVPNPSGRLRIGTYLEMTIHGVGRAPVSLVPLAAIQTVGDRHFVYIPEPGAAGQFREREVRVGSSSNGRIEVLTGLHPGDAVVTEGSFLLRSERQRLGLRPKAPGSRP